MSSEGRAVFVVGEGQPSLTLVVSKQPQTSGGPPWKLIYNMQYVSDYFIIWDEIKNNNNNQCIWYSGILSFVM